MIKRNPVTLDENSRDKSSTSKPTVKVTGIKVDENDYIDFSSPTSIKSIRESQTTESSAKVLQENGKMIERLMRTTTKDPSRKNPVDQGVEYSDYYSDDEVLQDIAANKIPMQLVDSENPNDRFARQAINSTSYRDNQIDRNLRSYYPDYDARRKEFRYKDDSVNYLNDFQNYPTIKRFSTLNRNSRLFGADDPSLSYAINYKPLEHRSGNFDAPYSANVAAIPERSQALDGNNFDTFDPNKSNDEQQPVVEIQNPDQFHYLNQYETAHEHFQSSNPNELQSPNVNEPGGPQVPQFQNINNYQQIESNLPREETSDQSVMNQPRIDNAGMPDVKGKDTEVHTQFNYSPLQLYNPKDQQENLKNSPAQPVYNIPAANIPNAMDQPLGKILESLGINVNSGSNNANRNENLNENINHQVLPYSDTYANGIPVEHFISPSYLKKKQNNEQINFYEDGNTKGLEYPAIKSRNRIKAREGYSRQSNKNGIYNNDILSRLDDYKDSSDNTNVSIAVHDTKEVASQILDTIMEELEELKEDRSKNDKREGKIKGIAYNL